MSDPVAVLRAVEAASKGLTYPSETDAPVVAFAWTGKDEPSAAALLARHALAADTTVKTTSLRDEFGPLAGDDGGADAPRWRVLLDLVEHDLRDVIVYRFGKPDVLIVVVGRTPTGTWLGLETRAVET